MKKTILFLCLLLVHDWSTAQNMEITTDVRSAKGVTIHSESTIIGDNVYSAIDVMQMITVTNLKTNKKIEKKVYDLNSEIHKLSNLRKNYRNLIVISQGRVVDGNVQFLIQSMGKEDKVNISRTTLDDQLNVVDEKLLVSYDLAHTQGSGAVLTFRTFKFDPQLELYYFGEYYSVPRKDDQLHTTIFNSDMEVTSDNSFELKNKDTELDPSRGQAYVNSAYILDDKTLVINIQSGLYRIKNNAFTPIPLNLKKSIDTYKIHTDGKGGIRFVGCYTEDKGIEGLAVIDFNDEMIVTTEKFQNIPKELNVTQKDITGKGFDENVKSRSFYLRDFKVNADGTTDIVLFLRSFTYLNYTVIKIDAEAKIVDQLVIPYGTKFIQGFNLIFENDKIIILTNDNEEWFDNKGEYNEAGYPNRKEDNYVLTAIVIPSDDFKAYTRRQVQIENKPLSEFNSKTQQLSFKNVKLDDNSYLMSLGEGNWRSGFTAQFLGKISF
jgi:hypothetical protein